MATSRQCKRALELHELELSSIDTVVGLGVMPEHDGRRGAGGQDMAIAIYVSKKPRKSDDKSEKLIHKKLVIPGRQGSIEVPIRVIETGEIIAESETGENLN